MKTYAFHKDGKIKKVFTTTKDREFVEKNLPKDLECIEASKGAKTSSHLVVGGHVVKDPNFVPKPFSIKKPITSFSQSFGVTEAEIDACKDIESLKILMKKMIAPRVI